MTHRNGWIFAVVLVACVGCDQAAKQVADGALAGSPPISVAGDMVRLELASNPGGFLSLGAGLPSPLRTLIFFIGAPLGLVALCVLFLRAGTGSRASLCGLGMLAGGGIGNWLDRLLHGGAVTDFVSLGWGPLRTGIFNLADVAVVAGVALLLLAPRERGGTPATEEGGRDG